MKVNVKRVRVPLPYLIALFIGIIEFYAIYHSDLPPGYGYSPLPKQVQVQIIFNVLNVWIIGLYTYLVNVPLELAYLFLPISYADFNSASFFMSFIVAFMTVFASVRYYLKKYFNAGNYVSTLIAILVDIPFQITYYNYWIYPALYLFTLAIYDYGLDFEELDWKSVIQRGLILAIGTSLGFQDARSIFYTIITFIIYSIYYILLKKMKYIYLKNYIKVLATGVPILLALDFQIIVARYFLAPYVSPIAVTAIYSQITMPLTWYHPFYTLLGTINWTGPLSYSSNLALGAVSVGFSFLSLLKRRPITTFFSSMLLAIVTYDFIGTRTIGYILANSPLVEYLIYLYVQYIPAYLYSSYFYALMAFSLYVIYSFASRSKKLLKIAIAIAIVVSSLTIMYYQPQAVALSQAYTTVPLNNNVKAVIHQLVNASGIVLVLCKGEDYPYFQLYLPYAVGPQWFGYMNFIWYSIFNSPDPAKALAYLGVEYVVVNALQYPDYYAVLSKSHDFIEVYNFSGIYVFKNLDFRPFYISQGVYIAFNFPYAILGLSNLSGFYPIIPFYYVDNLRELLPYVRGFIGYNVTVNDIIPMLVTNDSYIITATNIYVNQVEDTSGYNNFDIGWVHSIPYNLPDLMNGLTLGSNSVPLVLHINVPDGTYYVYAILAFYTYFPYESGSIEISSGNSITYSFTGSVYNLTWNYLGKIRITNHKLILNSISQNMNIVKIVLIPETLFNSLKEEAKLILNSRGIIDFNNDNTTTTNTSFVPNGYTAVVWANPWLEFLFFTHEVQVNGDLVGKYQYYFGTTEIYVSNTYPQIIMQKETNIYIPALSFLVNLIAILYLIVRNKNILKYF